jgi:transposase-like protein
MARYTEDDLQEAFDSIQSNGISIRQAAKDWGVPFSTLRDRMTGAQPKGQYESQVLQKISIQQEQYLANWIQTQEALGLPV